ncbi:MAG: SurA N-terminal domain-containing protein [Bacteroidales bacterium]|nr:SurA N-terminal domain-containing protein [Bacteroidales bacterium]
MAVLQKMRGWGIVLSILVAIPLLLFIIDPSQIMQTVQSVSSRNDVGKINGKSISYMDFQQDVDKYQTITEILTGNSANEEAQKQARDAAWQSLVDKYLFLENASKAGIVVGKDEILDLTVGENVSPLLANNGLFYDENGEFSADRVRDFVQMISDGSVDPRYSTYWDYLQTSVKTAKFYEKYNALFTASSFENALSLRNAIQGNNETADVDYVMVPLSFVTDTTVVVSDKEIKDFYKNHKDFYRQQASREIEYAVFEVVPSADDIARESASFVKLYDEFASASNVRSFLQRNSDRQWSDYFYKVGELNTVNRDVESFVAANGVGAVSPVIQDGNTFYAAKVVEQASLPDSVYVRHILFQGADAAHMADSLMGVLKKNDFQTLAMVYSADKGSAADGQTGNIGWMTQSYMIPGFESVISAKVGVPFILNTQYGTHIVEVTKATKPVVKKKVAIFEKEALASKETFNTFYNKANRLATIAAGKGENYKAACDSVGAYSHPMTIRESTDTYGTISHAKEVTRWAFDNKPGKVSQIITVDNNYFFVVAVKEAHKEGFAEIREVAPAIKNQLYAEKYAEKRQKEVAEEIAGLETLGEVAEKLDATVSSQSGVAFAAMSRSLDPKFIGAIAAAKEGVLSGPVAGSYGVYVFQVTGRDTGAYYTEDDAKTYNGQLTSYEAQMILPVMMDDADVKDNRARFF